MRTPEKTIRPAPAGTAVRRAPLTRLALATLRMPRRNASIAMLAALAGIVHASSLATPAADLDGCPCSLSCLLSPQPNLA